MTNRRTKTVAGHDIGSAETDNLQRADQTETPSLVAASALSLPDFGEGGPAVVDIPQFTAVKLFDKRLSTHIVEYRYGV